MMRLQQIGPESLGSNAFDCFGNLLEGSAIQLTVPSIQVANHLCGIDHQACRMRDIEGVDPYTVVDTVELGHGTILIQ
jgi:hypothetical protein